VIASAKAHGIRLIIALYAFVPFWRRVLNFPFPEPTTGGFYSPRPMDFPLLHPRSDYGGMDVYTAQLLGSGQPHDAFYTNPTVIVSPVFHFLPVKSRLYCSSTPGCFQDLRPNHRYAIRQRAHYHGTRCHFSSSYPTEKSSARLGNSVDIFGLRVDNPC
jgi:hypothetical protein